jgi:peptidoglycan-associated lipoprotein
MILNHPLIKTAFALIAFTALVGCSSTEQNGGANGAGSTAGGSGTAVPGSEQDLAQNVGDRVLFAYNESSLSGDARATLDKQSAWLGQYPQVSVQIAGNCDERGTEEYNLALGQRRANAARDYLVARGVSSARIATISYGKDRPTALGSDEASYAQNRNAITSVR